MNQEALATLIASSSDRLFYLWQFFAISMAALLQFVSVYDEAIESLNIIARAIMGIVVGAYLWASATLLWHTYYEIDGLHAQFEKTLPPGVALSKSFRQSFVSPYNADVDYLIYGSHGAALLLLLLILIGNPVLRSIQRWSAKR